MIAPVSLLSCCLPFPIYDFRFIVLLVTLVRWLHRAMTPIHINDLFMIPSAYQQLGKTGYTGYIQRRTSAWLIGAEQALHR